MPTTHGGNTTTTYHNGGASTGARYNPIRYRGYYYDRDLGMYWLQTRLYNPSLRRFMSPDSYVSTGQGLTGYNMYAYCGNDPVNRVDYTGESPWAIFLIISAIVIVIAVATIIAKEITENANNETNAALDEDPETTTKNKIIDSQGDESVKLFRYGWYSVEYNGCEAIAVHNARVLLGLESSLSDTIATLHETNAMYGFASGVFGSNPRQIDRVLDSYGMSYVSVELDEMTQPGVYIMSYWVEDNIFGGIHTIAVVYDGNDFYRYNQSYYFDPQMLGNRYICGYFLGQ